MGRNRENAMIELFKQQGLNVKINKNYMDTYDITIDVGTIDELSVHGVSNMIKASLNAYGPVLFTNKMDEKAHKKMADYETFFRLLRGGE